MSSKASWQEGEVACTEVELKDTASKKVLTQSDLENSTIILKVTKPDKTPLELEPESISEDGWALWQYTLDQAGEWDRHLIVTGPDWQTKRPLGKLVVGND